MNKTRAQGRIFRIAAWMVLAAMVWEQTAGAAAEVANAPRADVMMKLPAAPTAGETVIHIQDAHAHIGAQKKIADILDGLVARYDLQMVAMEGSSGPIDVSSVSLFPDLAVRRAVGECLLDSSRISAAEWAVIRSGRPMGLYGVEDRALYRKNLEAFDGLVGTSATARRQTQLLLDSLRSIAPAVVSPELAARWHSREQRRRPGFAFRDYWKSLAAGDIAFDMARYSELARLHKLMKAEADLRFDRAEQERGDLLKKASRSAPRPVFESLVQLSVEYRNGKMSAARFHRGLLDSAGPASRVEFPELARYASYLEEFEAIDLLRVLEELDLFEDERLARAAVTAVEKKWLQTARSVEALDRMLGTALSGREYEEVRLSPGRLDIGLLNASVEQLAAPAGIRLPAIDAAAVRGAFAHAERFYVLAYERNRVLLANTLAQMRREGKKVAALVSGGFHTEGLRALSENTDVGYWVVMPEFQAGEKRPYVTVLTKKPQEFENVFEDGSFLAPASVFDPGAALGHAEDLMAVDALVLAAARFQGKQLLSRRYLRERVRSGGRAVRELAQTIRDPGAVRREQGGMTVRFPSATFLVRQKGGKLEYPVSVKILPASSVSEMRSVQTPRAAARLAGVSIEDRRRNLSRRTTAPLEHRVRAAENPGSGSLKGNRPSPLGREIEKMTLIAPDEVTPSHIAWLVGHLAPEGIAYMKLLGPSADFSREFRKPLSPQNLQNILMAAIASGEVRDETPEQDDWHFKRFAPVSTEGARLSLRRWVPVITGIWMAVTATGMYRALYLLSKNRIEESLYMFGYSTAAMGVLAVGAMVFLLNDSRKPAEDSERNQAAPPAERTEGRLPRFNFFPELTAAGVTYALGASLLTPLGFGFIWLVASITTRAAWFSAVVVHEAGHGVGRVVTDGHFGVFTSAFWREAMGGSWSWRALMPFQPIYTAGSAVEAAPGVSVGDRQMWKVRVKALKGPLFNLLSIAAVYFMKDGLWAWWGRYGEFGIVVATIFLASFATSSIIAAMFSLTDWLAVRTGETPAYQFLCGVFTQLSPRRWQNPEEPATVISAEERATTVQMARVTKERGSQAMGAAALVRLSVQGFEKLPIEGVDTARIIANPDAIEAPHRPEYREAYHGVKLLNERGFDIVDRLERYWEKAEVTLEGQGFERASLESELDHSRLVTQGANVIEGAHPHQHLETRRAWTWVTVEGVVMRALKILQNIIVHNGDFNALFIFGKELSNAEARVWLDRVLHRAYGARWWLNVRDWVAVFNDVLRFFKKSSATVGRFFKYTPSMAVAAARRDGAELRKLWALVVGSKKVGGDSPGIAGMMDLLTTEFNWYASLRVAYQFSIAQSAEDRVPQKNELLDWTALVESEYSHRLSDLYVQGSAASPGDFRGREPVDAFIDAAVARLMKDPSWPVRDREKTTAFLRTAVYFFVNGDGRHALRTFMRMTYEMKGSTYGLGSATTLHPDRMNYAAFNQPFFVGYNPSTKSFRAGSDMDTVRKALADPDAPILRLDQNTGELYEAVLGGDLNNGLYSLLERRELTAAEIAERWIPKNSPYYQVEHSPEAHDRVRRDIDAIPSLMERNRKRWTDDAPSGPQGARLTMAYDPLDSRTYHIGTADHFFELLAEIVNRFEQLQQILQKAGIDEAISPTAPDLVIIGIENSLNLGQWWAELLQIVFPLLRDRIRVIHANEFVMDPQRFTLGPNTIVWNISRSGQTFPSFHSTAETVRLRDRRAEAEAAQAEAKRQEETEKILKATERYLETLERRRSVREVFVLSRDLGSEMAAVVGQRFQVKSKFLQTILTDGGWKSDSEPASQSVLVAYQTLAQMTLYVARRLRERYPNGSHPLGLAFNHRQLSTLDEVLKAAIVRTIPKALGIDAQGQPVQTEAVFAIDRQGLSWGRSIQESGWYGLLMKAYVFTSVNTQRPFFGWAVTGVLLGVLALWKPAFIADHPILIAAATITLRLFDSIFYTWGTEILTYLDRFTSGRVVLARHGTRTIKIFARRTAEVLDVFLGKMFAESPTYFTVFRRFADPVKDALQSEAFDATAGTLVLVAVPDGRLSADLAKEEESTLMTAAQVKASGNRLETTPEVVLITTNPELAKTTETKGFQNVLVIPSETKEILQAAAEGTQEVRDRMGDAANLLADSLSTLAGSYRLFWATADRASKVRLFGREFRIWDTSKTPDQANVHTTAAPNAPEGSGANAAHDPDWIRRALPDQDEFWNKIGRPKTLATSEVELPSGIAPLSFAIQRTAGGYRIGLSGEAALDYQLPGGVAYVEISEFQDDGYASGNGVEAVVSDLAATVWVRFLTPILVRRSGQAAHDPKKSIVLPSVLFRNAAGARLSDGARLAGDGEDEFDAIRARVARERREQASKVEPSTGYQWPRPPRWLIGLVFVVVALGAGTYFFKDRPIRGPDFGPIDQAVKSVINTYFVKPPIAPVLQTPAQTAPIPMPAAAEEADENAELRAAEEARLKTLDRALRNYVSVDYHLERDNTDRASRNFKFADRLLGSIQLNADEARVAAEKRAVAFEHLNAVIRASAPAEVRSVETTKPVFSTPTPAPETNLESSALPELPRTRNLPLERLLMPAPVVESPAAVAAVETEAPQPPPPAKSLDAQKIPDVAGLSAQIGQATASAKEARFGEIRKLRDQADRVRAADKKAAEALEAQAGVLADYGPGVTYRNVIQDRGLDRADWLMWEGGKFVMSGQEAKPGLRALNILEDKTFQNRLLKHALRFELMQTPQFSDKKKAEIETNRLLKEFNSKNAAAPSGPPPPPPAKTVMEAPKTILAAPSLVSPQAASPEAAGPEMSADSLRIEALVKAIQTALTETKAKRIGEIRSLREQAKQTSDPKLAEALENRAEALSQYGWAVDPQTNEATRIGYDNVIESRALDRSAWVSWQKDGGFTAFGHPAVVGLKTLSILEDRSFRNRLLKSALIVELQKAPDFTDRRKAEKEASRLLKTYNDEKKSVSDRKPKVGVLLPAGQDEESARSVLAGLLSGREDRFVWLFSVAGETSQAAARRFASAGAAVILDGDSLQGYDTRLALLNALAQMNQRQAALAMPFVNRMLSGDGASLSAAEREALMAALSESFPKPARREIVFGRGTLSFEPEFGGLSNDPFDTSNHAARAAMASDVSLAQALESADGARLSGVLARISAAIASFLSASEARQARSIVDAKLKGLIQSVRGSDRARWMLADPSYRTDLSVVRAEAARPGFVRKTIVTDLDVFLKDAEGRPFGRRIERLERVAPGLFNHVLLVRDARFADRASLLAAYPETALFGTSVIFAPGLTDVSELAQYRSQFAIEAEFLSITTESGGLTIGAGDFGAGDRVYLLALDDRAATTVGVLEQAALALVRHLRPFERVLYLPPVAGIDYEAMLERFRISRTAETAA